VILFFNQRHSIPLSAIPCLAYGRALRDEEARKSTPNEGPTATAPSDTSDPKVAQPESESVASGSAAQTNGCTTTTTTMTSQDGDKSQSRKRKPEDIEEGEIDCEPEQKKRQVDATETEIAPLDRGPSKCPFQGATVSPPTASPGFETPVSSSTMPVAEALPQAKVETAKENHFLHSIDPIELRRYCQSLFHFKKVRCKRFK
jgi:hypothetical protein